MTTSRAAAVAVGLALALTTVATALGAPLAQSGNATVVPPIVGNVKNGKKIFKAHLCGTCHMFSAAATMGSGGVGPTLDGIKLSYAKIVTFITKSSIKKGMNPYADALTKGQIQDTAAFIYTANHPK